METSHCEALTSRLTSSLWIYEQYCDLSMRQISGDRKWSAFTTMLSSENCCRMRIQFKKFRWQLEILEGSISNAQEWTRAERWWILLKPGNHIPFIPWKGSVPILVWKWESPHAFAKSNLETNSCCEQPRLTTFQGCLTFQCIVPANLSRCCNFWW